MPGVERPGRCLKEAQGPNVPTVRTFAPDSAQSIGWTALAMDLGADGAHRAQVGLPRRRHYAYQFVLDGHKVINDPAANELGVQPNGGHASVLLT